jgi:carbon monoxide dehydrogenase subunit G
MKINQSFSVIQPRADVWKLFQDIPALAECMPGAMLTQDNGDGTYKGQVSIKLGPFTAAFEGEAKHDPRPAEFAGHVVGKGIDRRGGSRSSMTMSYRLTELDGGTQVAVDADVRLSGPIAQFGRAGIVQETAGLLIEQFVGNIEQKLASGASGARSDDQRASGQDTAALKQEPPSLSGFAVLRLLIARYLRRLFGARTSP